MKKMTISLLVVLMLVGMIPSVMALEGPVDIPLLGVNVSDSDPGGEDDKEQWGREGGRTFGFTVYQASEYDQLKWRPVNVGIAFDGEIDTTNEILTFDSYGVGSAVWIGDTIVEVKSGAGAYYAVTVNTEFILTVKDASDSLVSFALMDGIPTVDLKALTPNAADEVSFTATLEMRAQMPSYTSVTAICPYTNPTVGEYLPALNVFDCLHTNPAYVRPAITMFDAGFFYEIPSFGLAEHDAHMAELVGGVQTTVDDIYMQTDYLYNELPGRIGNLDTGQTQISDMWTGFLYNDWPGLIGLISDLNTAHTQIGGTLDNVFTTVEEINAKVDSLGGDTVLNKLDDISEGVSKIPDFILLMFGLTAFIQDEELRGYWDAVQSMSPLYQKLDSITGTLNLVNDKTDANTQGISDTLAQSQQNAQTLTQISSQVQEYANIIASLTSQLEAKNQVITNLNVVIASMYTQEELDQAIADACPGNSEYPGQPGNKK